MEFFFTILFKHSLTFSHFKNYFTINVPLEKNYKTIEKPDKYFQLLL